MIGALISAASRLAPGIFRIASKVAPRILPRAPPPVRTFASKAANVVRKIVSSARSVVNNIVKKLPEPVKRVAERVSSSIASIKSRVTNINNAVRGVVRRVVHRVKHAKDAIPRVFKKVGSSRVKKVGKILKEAGKHIAAGAAFGAGTLLVASLLNNKNTNDNSNKAKKPDEAEKREVTVNAIEQVAAEKDPELKSLLNQRDYLARRLLAETDEQKIKELKEELQEVNNKIDEKLRTITIEADDLKCAVVKELEKQDKEKSNILEKFVEGVKKGVETLVQIFIKIPEKTVEAGKTVVEIPAKAITDIGAKIGEGIKSAIMSVLPAIFCMFVLIILIKQLIERGLRL